MTTTSDPSTPLTAPPSQAPASQAAPSQAPRGLFSTVLIANRGEIACRVIETLHRLGITAVAIYSEADAGARHVRMADVSVCVGPAAAVESYLDIEAVIEAARRTGAEAIHPGYGFLSENVAFARACTEAGLVFIGPDAHALEVMGDKIRSKNHVAEAGVPMADGVSEPGLDDEALIAAVAAMTYPLLIKPSAGGGGKGMHVVERPEDLPEMLKTARRVAASSFGDDSLLIEQLIRSPRHIEVQVLADAHGSVVHLGERECSLQRRHQKVVEEAPSSLLDAETRERIGQAACDTARSVDYRGAGTVEFLISDEDPERFYFMEMNTRLQVEHPVTEQVTGVDLVEQQIRIAAGLPMTLTQDDIVLHGHSVEARVYSEVPEAGFLPSTGTVLALREPSGEGVRVDSGLRTGTVIGTDYDPMLAKIITWGADREQAFARLEHALGETVVLGVETNLSFLRSLAADPDVRAGRMDTTMIDRMVPQMAAPEPDARLAEAAALWVFGEDQAAAVGPGPAGWRHDGWRTGGSACPSYLVRYTPASPEAPPVTYSVLLDGSSQVEDLGPASPTTGFLDGAGPEGAGRVVRLSRDGTSVPYVFVRGASGPEGIEVWAWSADFSGMLTVLDRRAQTLGRLAQLEAEQVTAAPEVTAPLPGTVVAVEAASGETVSAGAGLVTIEAMKMEHRLTAPMDGIVRISVDVGETVSRGQVLAAVEVAEADQTAEASGGPAEESDGSHEREA